MIACESQQKVIIINMFTREWNEWHWNSLSFDMKCYQLSWISTIHTINEKNTIISVNDCQQ